MNNRYIIHDRWMGEQHIGTKVKCNKKDHCAFKIGKDIHTFHVEQVVLEKYTPLPKKLKVKTVYEIKTYSSSRTFNSIAECLKYIRKCFDNAPVEDHKQFLEDISIIPKMVVSA